MATTKKVVVLKLKKDGKHVAHHYDGISKQDGNEDEPHGAFKDTYMPKSEFEDMGSPEVITVTIEVGDTTAKSGSKRKGKK